MTKLVEQDYIDAAKSLGCEISAVKAVVSVESGGSGFFKDGHCKTLFEGHVFYRELQQIKIDPKKLMTTDNADVLYKTWTRRFYGTSDKREVARLNEAIVINLDCALRSASWGMFQILGDNHVECGCKTIGEFVTIMRSGEKGQLGLFINFLKFTRLDRHLITKSWGKFALGYNGRSYAENEYDKKLDKSYKAHKKLNK